MNKEYVNKQEKKLCPIDWHFVVKGDAIYMNPETKKAYTEAEIEKFVVDLAQDENPDNPLKEFNDSVHFGVYCGEHDFTYNNEGMNEKEFKDFVKKHIKDSEYIFLPVYMSEDMGMSFSLKRDVSDSVKLGYIWTKFSELKKAYKEIKNKNDARKRLIDSIEESVFPYWAGDAWNLRILDESGKHVIAQSDYSVFGYDYADEFARLMFQDVKNYILRQGCNGKGKSLKSKKSK